MADQAFVTLATNDSYARGAMVLGKSLRNTNTSKKLVALIGPHVSEPCRSVLRMIYDEVKVVDLMDSGDTAHLAMMKRPDLGVTFTKLNCWTLTHYSKCVFMDADTLVLSNIDELFDREELSAAPDPGWPDCFNSGVFVFRPSVETYGKLLQFCTEHGSFDGGDQGVLNGFFCDWATADISKHLPFIYNLSSVAIYTYLPAFKQSLPLVQSCAPESGPRCMVEMPRWSTFLGRPSHGVTHLTPRPNRFRAVGRRPPLIPPSSWTGGLCMPALWCRCCRSSMETSPSSPDVLIPSPVAWSVVRMYRVRAAFPRRSLPSFPQRSGRSNGSKARLTTWEWTPLTISRESSTRS
uniref:glycogenin glucosyltransferase n=1 Tax=Oryzias latipes TaxID=8090 RepID=H2M280_ORYLA